MTTYKEIKGTQIEAVATDPSNPVEGNLWYDTTNDVLKAYDATTSAFQKISRKEAVLSSITGNIITATAGNLTLNGSGFMSANLIVSLIKMFLISSKICTKGNI